MKTILTLAVSGCLLSTNFCLGQNLLMNGSFELPGGIPDGSVILLTNGDSRLTGWTVGGTGGPIALHHGLSLPLIDFPPADGDYHLNFNAGDFGAGTWIAQAFNTTAGGSYLVTYQVGKIGATTSNVSLTVSALSQIAEPLAQQIAIPPPHGYGTVQSLAFTATTPLTTLKFLDTSADTVGVDVLLDNVVVQEVVPITNAGFEDPALGDGQENGPGLAVPGWVEFDEAYPWAFCIFNPDTGHDSVRGTHGAERAAVARLSPGDAVCRAGTRGHPPIEHVLYACSLGG